MAAAMSESSQGVRSEPVSTGPKLGRPILINPNLTREQQTNT